MQQNETLRNQQTHLYLSSILTRQTIPQAFLITGPRGAGKTALAGHLARALVCTGAQPPCGSCPACVKSAAGTHPDLIWVAPEDATLKVDTIRALRSDAFILPNEGERKVYILDDAERMTQEAQDALLKILEEPPRFTVFVLVCYNEQSLLATILSRCTRLKLGPGAETFVTHPEATRLLTALASGDELALLTVCLSLEKQKRDELLSLLTACILQTRDALVAPYGLPALTETVTGLSAICEARLLTCIDHFEAARRATTQNVGVAHTMGNLAAALYQTAWTESIKGGHTTWQMS